MSVTADRSQMRKIDFVIGGTSRSGTTLVQRLAGDLHNVQVAPETHFYANHQKLWAGLTFPLMGEDLTGFVNLYADRVDGSDHEVRPPVDSILSTLNGCARDPFELFTAITTCLVSGEGLVGEKTPLHVRRFMYFLERDPKIKVIGIIRHPNGVWESHQSVLWGARDEGTLAARWVADQEAIALAQESYPQRTLVLHHHKVVREPTITQKRIADFLEIDYSLSREAVHQLGSAKWKRQAGTEIDVDRAAWPQDNNSPMARRSVRAVTYSMRRQFEFPTESYMSHAVDKATRIMLLSAHKIHSFTGSVLGQNK